jgi:hypothetical protein
MDLTMELRSTGPAPQVLTVDYVLHLRKANGRTAPKVFKGATLTLAPGEAFTFRRCHRFRPVTTRRIYPGAHAVHLRINGNDTAPEAFDLT